MTRNVLVVDDSRTEALRTRLILEREGYRVHIAPDSGEGLTRAIADRPDLILLDAAMPRTNGFEIGRELKSHPATSAIPLIMLVAEEELAATPLEQRPQYFVLVPFEPQFLVAKIQEMTPHASPPQADDMLEKNCVRDDQRAETETAKHMKNDLLANISHELRTPLHEILGMLDLALGTGLKKNQRSYLTTAKNSSDALLSLINDVIEYSELESGQLVLDDSDFELADVVERTVQTLRPRAAEKGLELVTFIAPGTPHAIRGDAKRVRQVIATLIANGIKFTEEGSVSIRVDAESNDPANVRLDFQIRDTGVGIALDQREIIFEPFQQADISSTRRYGGMGMGLALAKDWVERMGGRIWIDDAERGGTIFHFTIQAHPATNAVAASTAADATPGQFPLSLNILVAEDSPTNQLIARASLKKAGHTTTIAVNGLEAVRAYEAANRTPGGNPFDLILMDVSMPEMDGLDATRRIRELEQQGGAHVIIVAMTAFATKEYQSRCLECGMDAYITKPVRIDELDRTIAPLMSQSVGAAKIRAMPVDLKDEPSSADTNAPPVDLKPALEVVGDDIDILREAVAMSLNEIPAQAEQLKTAMQAGDAKIVEARAHRLKGIFGNLGGLAVREKCQTLETMGENGGLDEGMQVFKALEEEIARVVQFYGDPGWEEQARASREDGNG